MGRKDQYRRKKGMSAFTGAGIFLLGTFIFVLLATTVFFNIDTVEVTGASNYTADEIIAASGIKAGDNLFRLNKPACSEKIENQLVYIENATLRMSFPSTLVIDVEASVPAANFICDDYILLVSENGKILDKIIEPKAGLLNFTGTMPLAELLPGDNYTSGDEFKDHAVNDMMEMFLSSDIENVTSIDVTDRAALSYTFDGRITVKLGSSNDLEYKINFAQKIIDTKIGEKTEGVLTLLSDSEGASFLDKESLENNAQVYNDNIAAMTTENTDESEEGENDEEESDESETSQNTPVME